MKTMKAFSKTSPTYGGEFIEAPIPTCGDDQVLVKVVATSICGTDVHIYQWDAWAKNRIKPPQIMGHEFVGRIVEVGKFVSGFFVGETITAETHLVCNSCEFCLNNQMHICENTKILGVDTDGAFAEYIAIPAQNAIKVNYRKPPEYLSILEPLGNAVHTVNSTDVKNKTVAVVGCGPIGLMAIDVAKAYKAKAVYAIEVNDYRIEKAKEMEADAIINPLKENVTARILALTNGKGVDVICEMSGKDSAIKEGFNYLKAGGHYAMLGVPDAPLSVDLATEVVFKGITIVGITGRHMFETWDQVNQLIDTNQLHLNRIVTHKIPFDQLEAGIKLMESGNCGKVVCMLEEH